MYDLALQETPEPKVAPGIDTSNFSNTTFYFMKRTMDIVVSLLLLPPTVIVGLILLVVNPFLNQGPLFFT